jgi:2-oxoisovalerate dehydrogenase E1 component beta subunit
MPSTPKDAYGLLLSCIVDPNPCFFLVPKALMRVRALPGELIPGEPGDDKVLSKMIDAPLGDRASWKPQWPDTPDYFVPFGEGRTVRHGRDATVVSYGRTLPLCVKAAEALAEEGVEAEVIDLRSLHPYDWTRISESVKRTGRVLYVNEDTEITNFGEHLVRRTVEELFYDLVAPPRLLAGAHVPGIGLADNLEMASVPQLPSIATAIRNLARMEP